MQPTFGNRTFLLLPAVLFLLPLLATACSDDDGGTGGGAGSAAGGGSPGTAGSPGTGGGGGATTSSCSLFKCASSADCAFQVCATSNTPASYCYGQAAKESECDGIGAPKTVAVMGKARIVCVPAGCSDPKDYVP